MAPRKKKTETITTESGPVFDRTKFSFKETFLNPNGKTSSMKLIGMAASGMCILMFIVMSIFYMFNISESAVVIVLIDKIIQFFGISAGLLGVKTISSSFGTNNRVIITNEGSTGDEECESETKEKRNNISIGN